MPRASHPKAVLWAFVECDVAEFVCRSVDYSILSCGRVANLHAQVYSVIIIDKRQWQLQEMPEQGICVQFRFTSLLHDTKAGTHVISTGIIILICSTNSRLS